MTDLTLEDLIKNFDPSTTTNNNDNPNAFWKKRYDFWKMNVGETAVVRFLPDANAENPKGFIVENIFHKLQVNGKTKIVPCLSMYGEPCPCCQLSQKYYAEEGDSSKNGSRLWKKREYLAGIKVMQTPFDIDNPDETKYVALGPKIYKIIQAAFKSGDLEAKPYNYENGYDFRIKKDQQGQYANYDMSSFSPRQTSLSEDVIANIELLDLNTLRTPKISAEEMNTLIMADQTGASVESVSSTVSGAGQSAPAQVDSAPTPQAPAQAAPQNAPVSQPAVNAGSNEDKVQDLLAKIRNQNA